MTIITILDGYVDEPTCLGVPPFLSTYPRYISGAILETCPKASIQYYTIDQIRQYPEFSKKLAESALIIVIAGMIVPGKYLSGYPAHPNELIRILSPLKKPLKLLCGNAATYGFGIAGGKKTINTTETKQAFDAFITGDPEIVIGNVLEQNGDISQVNFSETRVSAKDIEEYAKKGAAIVKKHPYFPNRLIVEIETYRGCSRTITNGCSFCVESKKKKPDHRSIESIISEIKALYTHGVRHFRIGNQPCLFSYQAKDSGKQEFPRPNPQALEDLFSGIRHVAPDLDTLHIDNVNPGIVARYPIESTKIASTIIKYHTSGDVAAFGVESIDPVVIKQNNLKANAEEILSAIRLFNSLGRKRGRNGLPELLPGLNFIAGLKGETKQSFELNLRFLQDILKNDLLLRRINIRQVIPLPNTAMEQVGDTLIKRHKRHYAHFKYQVKELVERPLLRKIVPIGTVLTNVIFELWKGKTTFGRQIGSYPLLVGVPGRFDLGLKSDVSVIDHGFRSVTALPKPLDINTAQRETIQSIPGVGKKRTIRILANRPFKNSQQFIKTFDDVSVAEQILSYISLNDT
ncbi:MAG: radical SAM protein [Candidatus Thermoplasmatota archaeon]|nr:radical SAM protein [Candidatus Thermoplasmatota archaeon]